MSGEFIIDRTTHWPILVAVYPAIPSQAGITKFLAEVHQIFHEARLKNVHLATVADLSQLRLDKVTSDLRSQMIKGLQDIDTKYYGVAVCDAVVSPSPFVRAFITAQTAVRTKRTHVTRAFPVMKDAVSWAQLTLGASRRHA